jgi:hypothetical protein
MPGEPSPGAKPQTAGDDDPDACTSISPTAPALAAQRSYADAWRTPPARPAANWSINPNNRSRSVPRSRSSCTTRSLAPRASQSTQLSAPPTPAVESWPLAPTPNPPSSAPPLAAHARYPASSAPSAPSLLPPSPLQRDSSSFKKPFWRVR